MPYDSEAFTVVETPTTPRENLKAVRDYIAAHPREYNYSAINACIVGQSMRLMGLKAYVPQQTTFDWLGLPDEIGKQLCFNHRGHGVGAKGAVRVINHLLKTGKVDWSARYRFWIRDVD